MKRFALVALFALAACSGGSSATKAAPSPTVNTQGAAEEARIACRFYVPSSSDPEQAQKFVDHAFTAARMDPRWQSLSDAASAFQSAQQSQDFAGLVQAIDDAGTACKEVP